MKGKFVVGKIVVENEAMIGLDIYEVDNILNGTVTDINGNFKLRFENDLPVIILTGSYYPLYARVHSDKFNLIDYENISSSSQKLSKRLSKIMKD